MVAVSRALEEDMSHRCWLEECSVNVHQVEPVMPLVVTSFRSTAIPLISVYLSHVLKAVLKCPIVEVIFHCPSGF